MEERLLALMDTYGLRKPAARRWQVLIQSFSPASLQKIHRLDPSLPLIQLNSIFDTSELLRAQLEAWPPTPSASDPPCRAWTRRSSRPPRSLPGGPPVHRERLADDGAAARPRGRRHVHELPRAARRSTGEASRPAQVHRGKDRPRLGPLPAGVADPRNGSRRAAQLPRPLLVPERGDPGAVRPAPKGPRSGPRRSPSPRRLNGEADSGGGGIRLRGSGGVGRASGRGVRALVYDWLWVRGAGTASARPQSAPARRTGVPELYENFEALAKVQS